MRLEDVPRIEYLGQEREYHGICEYVTYSFNKAPARKPFTRTNCEAMGRLVTHTSLSPHSMYMCDDHLVHSAVSAERGRMSR